MARTEYLTVKLTRREAVALRAAAEAGLVVDSPDKPQMSDFSTAVKAVGKLTGEILKLGGE